MVSFTTEELYNISNLRVVYFEDDYITAHYTKRCLSRYFDKIDIFNDPINSFDEIDFDNYDLVLTDLNMKEINGFTLIEKIKELNKGIKFIIISAHSDKEFLLKAQSLGVVGYINKPIMMDKVESVLKHMLEKDGKNLYAEN